ncbi:unnamed protein product [Adineta ricciae]|uniref:Isopenicillin N synthase-like Fe(2+) 2OG dioxygenase domain-containing protein n=1 Tax=Adineta ricciae TaxID=249248 RepID=A0A814W4J6_ADIRI|nr:unnamed protein product [Adineta ricciae]CAF1199159.1 unnamed protein product [Adineta ricciae]
MASKFLNDHIIIDFAKLSTGDRDEINGMQKEFETHGWCFIQLPMENDSLSAVQETLSTFFSRSRQEKLLYKSSNAFGYTCVDHKEGIKLLTDQYGIKADRRPLLTDDVEQSLQHLSTLFNDWMNILTFIILKMTEKTNEELTVLSSFNMLDIVNYFNERTGSLEQPAVGLNTNEVNCVPHYDPGLFSLSILSTCDGLQLQDRNDNKWIDGPNNSQLDQCNNIGVIWLGEAISALTEDRFKTGIHRVVYPKKRNQARLTIWQEVCTNAQVDSILENDDTPLVLPENTQIQIANQPNSEPLVISARNETLNTVMKRVENERGLSMSKVAVEHLTIRYPMTKKKPSSNSFFSKLFKW